MRAIDADALELEYQEQYKLFTWDDGEREKATLARVIQMLHAQPTIEERKWIPWDSGRLPDDSGTYIVTAYDGVQERVTFAKYQKRLKRWELTGARAYWRVLAWMPLPEPYRKDGD